jgi:peptidylprolyl isomerase
MVATVLGATAVQAGAVPHEPSLLDVAPRHHGVAWAVLDAENHRLADAPVLARGVAHQDAAVRALALQALGRIGSPGSLALVTPSLTDGNAAVRRMAAFAAGMIGGADAVAALKGASISEKNDQVQGELSLAVGRAGGVEDLAWLGERVTDPTLSPWARGRAAQGLGLTFLRLPAGTPAAPETLATLTDLAATAGKAAVPAAFALARYPGPADDARVTALVAALVGAPNLEARGFLARALGRTKADAARTALVARLQREPAAAVKVDIVRTLVNFGPLDDVLAGLAAAARDRSAQVRAQAFMTLESLGEGAIGAKDLLLGVVNDPTESQWVRGAALAALAAVSPADARPLVQAAISAPWPANAAALAASTHLGEAGDLTELLGHLEATSLPEAATAAGSAAGFADDLLDAQARAPFLAALSRPDLALTSIVAEAAGRRGWKEFARPLAKTYAAFTRPDDVEVKVAILTALGLLGDSSEEVVAVLQAALADDERPVSLAAAEAIKALTDTDVSDQVPAASVVKAETPTIEMLKQAATARLVVRTTRGKFVLRMNPSAPLTAHNVMTLARSKFYDGLTMHRVVPHFVAQGGDPRGDGYGGPGYVIRDEATLASHERGAVGIATAGKDTGGCQFFVDHGPNLHLDGAYTVFAHVEKGLDVVDALEQGDVIKSVKRL